MSQYRIESRTIRPDEYQKLRNSTNWSPVSEEQVTTALKNDLFTVCIMQHNSIVGMGRVIGDDGIYYYIQDVIVLPEHQGKGLGELIMEKIEKYLHLNASPGSFIGLMAAKDTMDFYKKFGYKPRPSKRPGMFKSI